MTKWAFLAPGLIALMACSGTGTDRDARATSTGPDTPSAPEPEPSTPSETGVAPLSGTEADPALATFVDPESGLSTQDVHDADREIVHFDLETQSMVWAANGDPVGGWVAQGNELRWQRTGGAFRVRFGAEAGERRAYFTETGPGTICNLSIRGPEQLSISPTSETPPRS